MKRGHKLTAGAGTLALLLGFGLDVWDRIEARREKVEHVAQDNHAAFECEFDLCAARGGWWKEGCHYSARPDKRQPK